MRLRYLWPRRSRYTGGYGAMERTTTELKPCPSPSCDSPGGDEGLSYYHLDGLVWVICPCGVQGPGGFSNDEAQALWNELPRAPTPEGEALREIADHAIQTVRRNGWILAILHAHGIQLPAEEGSDE